MMEVPWPEMLSGSQRRYEHTLERSVLWKIPKEEHIDHMAVGKSKETS